MKQKEILINFTMYIDKRLASADLRHGNKIDNNTVRIGMVI